MAYCSILTTKHYFKLVKLAQQVQIYLLCIDLEIVNHTHMAFFILVIRHVYGWINIKKIVRAYTVHSLNTS